MLDLLLPRTDAGALAQAVAVTLVSVVVLVLVRRNRDLVWFVAGMTTLAFAWFGLRTLH